MKYFMTLSFFVFFLSAPLLYSAAYAGIYLPVQTKPQDLPEIETGIVADILKPHLVRLDNGTTYVLDNVRIPVLMNDTAEKYLSETLKGKKVHLHASTSTSLGRTDRHGNIRVHVVTDDQRWIQAELVSSGLAWSYSSETNRDLALPLLALEEMARSAQKGFWTKPIFFIKDNQTIHGTRESFEVFQGVVQSVASSDDRTWINFGADYKTDFTLELDHTQMPKFRLDAKKYVDLKALKGMTIRTRGWVEEKNGPMIPLTHPEQIEFPDTSEGAQTRPVMPYDLTYAAEQFRK